MKEKNPKSEAKHAVYDVSKKFVGIVSAQNAGAGQNLDEDDTVGWLHLNGCIAICASPRSIVFAG